MDVSAPSPTPGYAGAAIPTPVAAPSFPAAAADSAATLSSRDTAPKRALRFLTAGSVDDGKSTLIGRLLYDSRAILADQLDTLERRAARSGRIDAGPAFDLALLTDGLEAEREQGITIDVAYRYFATPRRKFIIADAPGHEQYTRNMVTAAAGSDAAVVLVDITKLDLTGLARAGARPAAATEQPTDAAPVRADHERRTCLEVAPTEQPTEASSSNAASEQPTEGAAAVRATDRTVIDATSPVVPELLPQTRRHALLARLLRVPSIVFAINKLDAVPQPEAAFALAREALLAFAAEAGIEPAGIVPVSALRGDNVTEAPSAPGATLPAWGGWYRGPSLLALLEALPAAGERTSGDLLIPVQYVARESDAAIGATGEQPRTLWGRIAHGQVRAGDPVQLFPSREKATVAEVRVADVAVAVASAGQSAGVVLDRQLDVSRGDWIGTPDSVRETNRFHATLAWLDVEPAVIGRRYTVRHGNRWVQARITAIDSRLDIQTLEPIDAHELGVNEIGRVVVETQQPLPVEPYAENRVGGALIVVDPASNRTSGALLVEAA